jgi:helix-turn-helix protein
MTSTTSDPIAGLPDETARKAYRTLEPLHIVAYFAGEPAERYAALGIKGGMRGYFASRSAALGQVPAEVVIATFFNFNPALVRKAIPSVWDVTTPEAVLEARYAGVSDAYRRILGEDILASAEMAEAADLAREATTGLRVEGRPLYAAHASLPWPEPAHLQLFHAQTLLREHRGDGHIAALVVAGLDAVEALVTYAPIGPALPPDALRATRAWSDEEWNDGIERARARGLLDAEGALTAVGVEVRATIEAQTDAAAVAPYRQLGAERTERLRNLARPWSRAISEAMFGTPA